MGRVVDHPAAALMAEVEAERALLHTPEAQALQDAIFDALRAYYEYLDHHGLFYDVERGLVRASALHATYDGCSYEIILKDGAIDRRYGTGEDPDPECRDLNPTWPPSKVPPSPS